MNRPNQSTVVESGVVEPPIRSGAGESTFYLKFGLRTKNDLFECTCFGDLAERFKAKLSPNMWVMIRGYYKDHQSRAEKKISVTMLAEKDAPLTPRDALIKEYGSIEKYKAERRRYEEYQKSQGLVNAYEVIDGKTYERWIPKEQAVLFKGRYWTEIDYLEHVLGAEILQEELREFTGAELLKGRSWVPRYREKIKELMEQAEFLSKQD